MRKSRTPTCTPKLRFPEFRDATEWAQKVGEDLFLNRKEIGEDGLPIYSVTINDGMVPRASFDRDFYDIADSAGNKKVREGDIAYNMMRMWQGALGVAPTDCMVSPAYVVLAPKEGTCTAFFAQLFKLPQSLELLTATSRGLTKDRLRLYFDDFARMRLCAPEYDEQRRIAACLASLDELIVATSDKLDALKAHKKGLMQQLFPREGETVPRLRFPEFRAASNWSPKGGGDLFAERKEDGETGLPIYSVTINDGMVPRASFDRDFYDIEDPAGNKKVCKGDIAYNMMRMWQGAQGVAAEDCMVSPAYVVLAPRGDVCPDFFAYLFKLPHMLHLLTATSRGLTKDRLRLYFDDFARMRLCVPESDEQRRIATCLSSLDDLIAVQAEQLEVLKIHKKGLMQQLFPPPAEAVE